MDNLMRPSEVFVPGHFPIEKHNIYADRGSPQLEFIQALDRGFVPVVFGSYGVGKSSLAMHCAKIRGADDKLVYVASVFGKTLKDVFSQALEHLGYEIVSAKKGTTQQTSSGELGTTVEGGVFGLLKGALTGKTSRSWNKSIEEHKEIIVKSPTDSRIIDLCDKAGLFFVIDELHQATEEFRRDLSAFIKAYANKNCKNLKFCLLGTENDANALVARDLGIDRVLQEIQLKPITENEALLIVIPGMKRLNLTIDEDLAKKLARISVGSPFIVQYLSLEMAESALEAGRTQVLTSDFDMALDRYARRKAQRLIRAYRGAIETTGVKKYRKQILLAMALSEDEYITMDYIVSKVSKQLGKVVPNTSLSGPLRELKNSKFGSILRDVEGLGQNRLYNYSAFSDPAMRSIIRMIRQEEFAKLIHDVLEDFEAALDFEDIVGDGGSETEE